MRRGRWYRVDSPVPGADRLHDRRDPPRLGRHHLIAGHVSDQRDVAGE